MLVELLISSNCDNDSIVTHVKLNNSIITTLPCTTQPKHVQIEVNDDIDAEQQVTVEMLGKNTSHTTIDASGNIVHDVVVNVDKIIIDDNDVTALFCTGKQCYTHDFNGTQDSLLDEFYGVIGCNGVVTISFTTPIFIWLLDNT